MSAQSQCRGYSLAAKEKNFLQEEKATTDKVIAISVIAAELQKKDNIQAVSPKWGRENDGHNRNDLLVGTKGLRLAL
jgi:hypothetical protein